ncbi:sulfite exporter TauE/SafE family protein [Paenibacillus sp. SYP-B4298]|uniref:sulfite exporter TauE/SafE family protein n=1 Tax=Paenibacillus sp. SYP-B4298 TaxID=2996034 RepID=UPI0022DD7EE4|nr:sulfite exporter TauE/SafE family protein [Paenibacillus sp. SYP-B4298]
MISSALLSLAVLAGLSGAPHCIAMCGGIVSAFALQSGERSMRAALAYNVGRVVTYTAIGGLMGLAGSFLNMAGGLVGIQGAASMLGGLLILLWAWRRYTLPIYPGHRLLGQGPLQRRLAWLGTRHELLAPLASGLLLGLLPCGLTYAMQMNAASTGSWVQGALLLLAFGLSTLPAMLLTALLAGKLGRRWRHALRRAGLTLAILMGMLALLKGMSVSGWIPAIHPWLW